LVCGPLIGIRALKIIFILLAVTAPSAQIGNVQNGRYHHVATVPTIAALLRIQMPPDIRGHVISRILTY
jgi:hypothetical protein